MSRRTKAILIGLFVTFLWSTSWVFIRIGLHEIPAILFAGLRYFIAFAILFSILLLKYGLKIITTFTRAEWISMFALGILFYAVAQGGQYVGLALLPTMTVSLLLNLTPVIVALLGIASLKEFPSFMQWLGIIINAVGILLYFYPVSIFSGSMLGLVIVVIAMLANAIGTIIGRKVNRDGRLPVLVVTTISMGIGAIILLTLGILQDGLPIVSPVNWIYLIWMAAINTALGFSLWNLILKDLSAAEASIINGTMMIQIAAIAWIILHETLTSTQIAGMALSGVGVILVQIKLDTHRIKKTRVL